MRVNVPNRTPSGGRYLLPRAGCPFRLHRAKGTRAPSRAGVGAAAAPRPAVAAETAAGPGHRSNGAAAGGLPPPRGPRGGVRRAALRTGPRQTRIPTRTPPPPRAAAAHLVVPVPALQLLLQHPAALRADQPSQAIGHGRMSARSRGWAGLGWFPRPVPSLREPSAGGGRKLVPPARARCSGQPRVRAAFIIAIVNVGRARARRRVPWRRRQDAPRLW